MKEQQESTPLRRCLIPPNEKVARRACFSHEHARRNKAPQRLRKRSPLFIRGPVTALFTHVDENAYHKMVSARGGYRERESYDTAVPSQPQVQPAFVRRRPVRYVRISISEFSVGATPECTKAFRFKYE